MSQATFCKVPPRNFRRLTPTYSLSSIGWMTYRNTTLLSAFLKSQQTHTTGTPLSLVPILLASLINSSIALAASLTKTSSPTSHHQAVGAPPEILRAEEERVLKELLLRKECSVCGKLLAGGAKPDWDFRSRDSILPRQPLAQPRLVYSAWMSFLSAQMGHPAPI
jgi:hypothetical protein